MKLDRRSLLALAMGASAAPWLSNYAALAAPNKRQAKITGIKVLGLDNVQDGCLIRIETDAGLVGHGEVGLPAAAARDNLQMLAPKLIGQDPLAIERHFYMLASAQYSFLSNIPTVSGIDIALWDLAGKILGLPVYQLLGGPIQKSIPVYSHCELDDILDKAKCRAWAQKVRAAPEKFNTYKFWNFSKFEFWSSRGPMLEIPHSRTLGNEDLLLVRKGFENLREAVGDDIDLAFHCLGEYDTVSAIGLCRAIEPTNPLWIEDPLTVRYSEAWRELKRATRVPILAGEKIELVEGFRPYLDNQVLDFVHPDVAYSGGITGCRRIAEYAALTRVPMGLHSGGCTLIRFYASMHLAAATENFFKVENALGPFRGNKEKMALGPEPVVRNSQFTVPEGPGLGLEINEDWLRAHVAKGETWWG